MIPFRRVLIANRGEIAKRLIDYYRKQGIETVSVFSEPDAEQAWVEDADYCVYLNGKGVPETYLHPGRVLGAAMDAGVDAIHPGYCFLAEHLGFWQMASTSNVAIIGADPTSIARAVDRMAVREVARQIGIPTVPSSAVLGDDDDGVAAAAQLGGAPLFVKAVEGGALRLVSDLKQLPAEVDTVRRAADLLTGDKRVYLERALGPHRAIGVTVVSDQHGNCTHLGPMEGTVSVDFHTWVEEMGPEIVPEQSAALGAASVRLARALRWVGVGKVRWAVTPDGGYYVLGFSARLTTGFSLCEQVHGIDLVQAQHTALTGGELDWNQQDAVPSQHGLQFRVFHGDPVERVRPEAELTRLSVPENVHATLGVDEGSLLGPHTEPLLAKLTVLAPSRGAALVKARNALAATAVEGVASNRDALLRLFDDPDFWMGRLDSAMVTRRFG